MGGEESIRLWTVGQASTDSASCEESEYFEYAAKQRYR
jgi:hypothetical protein